MGSIMQYRKIKDGSEVSILGFGCMRFPQKGNKIDMEETEKEILAAIDQGINYFDTAYLYLGSEEALGTILKRNNCRDKVNIATKLPQYIVKKPADIDKYFDEELKRLQTNYVDFYLMHMVADIKRWEKLKEYGIEEWIAQKKETGAIKNIGFSFHGDTDTFIEILDAYDWDFCQIQYNYLDEHTQAGRRGLQYAAAKGIPVIIMEPLRGGRLVKFMPDSAKKIIEEYPVKRTLAEWAFRWLWNQPEVTCVLSGMNSMEMLNENIGIASEVQIGEFTDADYAMIEKVKDTINRTLRVGCTGCGYCMPCPCGVDIPNTFACYNRMYTEKKGNARMDYLMATSHKKDASDYTKCVECGKCEQHCPQKIEIRKELKIAGKKLLPLHYRIVRAVMRKIMV